MKFAGATVCLACVWAAIPGCAPASAAEAFITDQTGDEVSVLDLGLMQIVARIPVLGKPAGIAMARDGRAAYVTSTEGKYVSVIDTASRKVVAKIAIPNTPLGIAADPAGRFIYVAGFYQPRLYKIDLATGAIAATVEVGAAPSGVAVAPDGALMVSADRDDNQISIIDAKTFARKCIVKVGVHPFGVTIDPQGARLYRASKATTCVRHRSRGWNAPRQRGGRQAALCRRAGERTRFFDRPIWRNGFGLRSCGAPAGEADFRWRLPGGDKHQRRWQQCLMSSIGSRTEVWAIDARTLKVTAKMRPAMAPAPSELFCAKRREFFEGPFGVERVSTRRKARWVSGLETAAGGIDKTTARDHDPAAATSFDRFHQAGTGNDLSRRDLDRAARTLDESDPVVNITDNPVCD